jgi:pimeloyl-ACP methyl ester carboxylesterase
MEEEGQRVRFSFWSEAGAVDFLGCFARLETPVYVVFGTADDFISQREMRSVEAACKPGDRIDVIEGLPHSAWPYEQRTQIIRETAKFVYTNLVAGGGSA